VQRVLVDGLAARHVFVGRGWRFGHKAAGDVSLLDELGSEANFEVTGVDLATYEGERVSSRRVRSAIADGDVELATALLGRPFDVDGIVEHGDDRGAALGFPTANLAVDPALARPPRGVYAGRGRATGAWHPAATNVGFNPTFGGDESNPLRIETFLLDFAGDLYEQVVRVEFWARLRDEETFDGPEELIAQMKADVEATRALVGG
jgi:riboflavin kinase/FMN adenylyltransferase